ncbi:MAG: hypothetical protein QXV32_03505 [Conexivisphaerales archaeon]
MKAELVDRREIERIILLCELATRDGSHITVDELTRYLPFAINTEGLTSVLESSVEFGERFLIADGVISPKITAFESSKRRKANDNLRIAETFSNYLTSFNIKVLAVSGSTSYLSAFEDDDIDLFCVTGKDGMWIFVTKALLLCRILRYIRRDFAKITISYVADEAFALRAFSTLKGVILAKDALAAKVIFGRSFYSRLLKSSQWIGMMFPDELGLRIKELSKGVNESTNDKAKGSRVVNALLYTMVGSYIRLKSYLLNRQLAKHGRLSALFNLNLGIDHLVYESTFYHNLGKFYSYYKGGVEEIDKA